MYSVKEKTGNFKNSHLTIEAHPDRQMEIRVSNKSRLSKMTEKEVNLDHSPVPISIEESTTPKLSESRQPNTPSKFKHQTSKNLGASKMSNLAKKSVRDSNELPDAIERLNIDLQSKPQEKNMVNQII